MDMLIADGHSLSFVFQDFHADAVRRFDKGLVQPSLAAREHMYSRGFPLRDPLLDVVDDEADMVHHRTLGAAISFLAGPEGQIYVDPREHDQRISAGHEQLTAHGEKKFFVR